MEAQTTISGHVVDGNKKPLAFVSITIFTDDKSIHGSVSDSIGHFEMHVNFDKKYRHTLTFSLIGYARISKEIIDTNANIIYNIILLEDKKILSDVTVSSNKPLVTRQSDRYIVNVENSFLANGNSGLELLQKSPGIWVDNNGSIRIKGTQPVMVMINDVVQRMTDTELAEYLKTLKSENISRIEVIANPSVEFEAAGTGGIVHIILKKAKNNGMNAAVNAQYRQQGNKPYQSMGSSLDYKFSKLYLFGNVSFTKDIKYIFASTFIKYPDKSSYENVTDRNENSNRQQYRTGFVYDLNTKHSIGLQTTFSSNTLKQSFVTDGILDNLVQPVTSIAYSNKSRKADIENATFNYVFKIDSAGSLLKIIADYISNDKAENSIFSTVYKNPPQNIDYRNNTPNATNVFSIQADYKKVVNKKLELKSGFKYASIVRSNAILQEDLVNGNWVENKQQSNQFINDEKLLMFYSSLEKNTKQVNIKVGLRAEETYSKGNSITTNQKFSRDYLSLFPSLFINKVVDEANGNSVYLNYSRRIQRPSLLQLNPARFQFDSYTAQTGNPNLLPQYSHNVQAGYSFQHDFMVDVYFTRTNNVIGLLANPGSNNSIEYQSENLNTSNEYGMNFNCPIKILHVWSASNSFSLYHISYSINDYDVSQNVFSAKSIHSIVLKNLMDIDAIINYGSPYTSSNYAIPSMFYFDMGFSKKILKQKGRVRLNFSDIFNTLREHELTDYKNTNIDFYQKRPTRTVSLTFSYSFSTGKKFNEKKIEQISEERNRSAN